MILIINGPNLNRLGNREKGLYGSETLEDIEKSLLKAFPDAGLQFFQSNSEGEIIDRLQQAADDETCCGVVINPGAFAHYSYAIADAIRDCPMLVVEVHISNIHARESWRANSVTAQASVGVIAGLGIYGYRLAIEFLIPPMEEFS